MSYAVDAGIWLAGLGLLLVAAELAGAVTRRLGLPTAIGYLTVGAAVGPFTPGYVADPSQIAVLDALGSAILLFVLGLAIDVEAMLREPRGYVIVPLLSHALATLTGSLLLTAFGVAPLAATTIALAIAMSSIVVTEELALRAGPGDHGSPTLRRVRVWTGLSAIAGVLSAILLTSVLAAEPPEFARVLLALLAFALVAVVVRRVLGLVESLCGDDRGIRLLVGSAALVTLVGGVAVLVGVAIPLAAFVVGLAVGRSKTFAHDRRHLQFRGIFVLMFFVAAGTLLDPLAVSRNIVWLLLVTLLVPTKVLLALALIRLYRLQLDIRSIAASLGPVGEFAVLLVGVGVSAGVLGHDERSVLLACAALTIGAFGYSKGFIRSPVPSIR